MVRASPGRQPVPLALAGDQLRPPALPEVPGHRSGGPPSVRSLRQAPHPGLADLRLAAEPSPHVGREPAPQDRGVQGPSRFPRGRFRRQGAAPLPGDRGRRDQHDPDAHDLPEDGLQRDPVRLHVRCRLGHGPHVPDQCPPGGAEGQLHRRVHHLRRSPDRLERGRLRPSRGNLRERPQRAEFGPALRRESLHREAELPPGGGPHQPHHGADHRRFPGRRRGRSRPLRPRHRDHDPHGRAGHGARGQPDRLPSEGLGGRAPGRLPGSRRRRRSGADPARIRPGRSGPGGPRRSGVGGAPGGRGQQHPQGPLPDGPEQRLQGRGHLRPADRQRPLRAAPGLQDPGAGPGEREGPFQPGLRGLRLRTAHGHPGPRLHGGGRRSGRDSGSTASST